MLTNEIDLSLLSGAQKRLEIAETVVLPPFGGLDFAEPVSVALVIERSAETIMIVGTAQIEAQGVCNRCLGTFAVSSVYDVEESFTTGPDADPFGEGNVVQNDRLDLSDLIRQVVDAALPLVLLCNEDCAGLCATCGKNLNEGTCECGDRTKGDHG